VKKSKTLAAALLSLGLFASCLGPNRLFNQLHSWNESATEDSWANVGIFVVFNVIPLYPLAYAGDIVLFNSIEWWSGSNPVERDKVDTTTNKSTMPDKKTTPDKMDTKKRT